MCRILLSFVVPLYNVEKYLKECLDSIFDESADKDEFEVIAVNDGSTDSSSEILKTYAHYKNFRIITQENAGPSVARNTGIKAASGRYIYFIDSDDFLLPDTVPVLLGWARESDSDIIEFEFEMTNETSLRLEDFRGTGTRSPLSGSGKAVFPQWWNQKVFVSVIWTRIYKRKLLTNNPLSFYPGIMQGDDEWIYRCFFYADSVVFHPLAIYNYRRRDGSISFLGGQDTDQRRNGSISFLGSLSIFKRCNDIFAIIDSLVDFTGKIKNNQENVTFLHAMNRVVADLYRRPIGLLSADWDIAKKDNILGELAKRRYLLKQMEGSKMRYLYWLLRLFSPQTALRLYNIIEKY